MAKSTRAELSIDGVDFDEHEQKSCEIRERHRDQGKSGASRREGHHIAAGRHAGYALADEAPKTHDIGTQGAILGAGRVLRHGDSPMG
jgi:hypothetical protein